MRIFFTLLFLGLNFLLIGQNTYYVSHEGNNNAEGSFEAPWLTIQFGLDQLSSGDTLLVREGEYKENLSINTSGTPNAFIVIGAFSGEQVRVRNELTIGEPIMRIDDQSHLIIQGLEFFGNVHGPGIKIDRSSNIILNANRIHQNKIGIHILNSTENMANGNHQVRNNFIYHNTENALVIGPEDMNSSSGLNDRVTIRHNSFFENDSGEQDLGEIKISNCNNLEVHSNTFYTNEQGLFGEIHEFFYTMEFDYNNYYSISGEELMLFYWNGQAYNGFENFLQQSGKEENGFFSNPLFLNVAESNSDLHITPNSPLINAGKPDINLESNERDIDGQLRANGKPDIGADEYYLQIVICALGVFNASAEEEFVRLDWSGTCFSENGGKYLVQRSRDKEDWETIGELQSKVEKFNTEVQYEYIDMEPLEGLSFYRTRFVDENGSYLDSNVDEVIFSEGGLLVYPNPVGSMLTLLGPTTEKIKSISIFNFEGKKIMSLPFKNSINTSQLKSGNYMIELMEDDGSSKHIVPLIKSNY